MIQIRLLCVLSMALTCMIAGCSRAQCVQCRPVSTRNIMDLRSGDIVARRVGSTYAILRLARLADIELLKVVDLDDRTGSWLVRQSDIMYSEGGRPSVRALLGDQATRTFESPVDGYHHVKAMGANDFLSNVCWIVPDEPTEDFVVLSEG